MQRLLRHLMTLHQPTSAPSCRSPTSLRADAILTIPLTNKRREEEEAEEQEELKEDVED
jgi:hypothetical protein